MVEIQEFENHIKQLQPSDWNILFSLLPEIINTYQFGESHGGEQLASGGITASFWSTSEIVDKTIGVLDRLEMYPVFDWMKWDEGSAILENKSTDYSKLDVLNLCKLLTVIIRQERFCDGFLVSCFENGVMGKIIRGLEKHFLK